MARRRPVGPAVHGARRGQASRLDRALERLAGGRDAELRQAHSRLRVACVLRPPAPARGIGSRSRRRRFPGKHRRTRMKRSDAGAAMTTQILIVGSGAGGAATATALAEAGCDVLILEEGPNVDTSRIASNSTDAISLLYRNGGMTPMLGRQSTAFVEGRCVGGSTEINSGFWHRLPEDTYLRWKANELLADFTAEIMTPYFERIEADLSVSHMRPEQIPRSSVLFREGAERLGWKYVEVPRCQKESGSQFAPGAKQSMQRTYIPRAIAAGARLLADCKATRIVHENGYVRGVEVTQNTDGTRRRFEVRADAVFLCCGAIQTPALLRRSGIRKNVGDRLCIHPMIK